MTPRLHLTLCVVLVMVITCGSSSDVSETLRLQNMVKEMFFHGYDNYMRHAFPQDELKPISCSGYNTLGNYTLTLIDSLDMLIVLGNFSEFTQQLWWIIDHIHSFDLDVNVSVFETNIRILGGLLSTHMLLTETNLPFNLDPPQGTGSGVWCGGGRCYNGELLKLAKDIGSRLLPAFNTNTKIPYGTVNLRYGVPPNETPITCTASGGTFSLEFGILSVLTGDPSFERAARNAVRGLWSLRSAHNLIGNHVNTQTGVWIHRGSGIGAGADSFYEYLLKAAIFFNDYEYYQIWNEASQALVKHTKVDNWYVEVDYEKLQITFPAFAALQAYWPGMQVLDGLVTDGILTWLEFYGMWRRFGFTPEFYDLTNNVVMAGGQGYPLRPELAESLYYIASAIKDPIWHKFGKDIVENLHNYTRTKCGHAAVNDVRTFSLRDHMDSFFLSETLKYLYLLYTPDHVLAKTNFVFNTEAHIFPISYKYFNNHAPTSPKNPSSSQTECPALEYWKDFSVLNYYFSEGCKKNPKMCKTSSDKGSQPLTEPSSPQSPSEPDLQPESALSPEPAPQPDILDPDSQTSQDTNQPAYDDFEDSANYLASILSDVLSNTKTDLTNRVQFRIINVNKQEHDQELALGFGSLNSDSGNHNELLNNLAKLKLSIIANLETQSNIVQKLSTLSSEVRRMQELTSATASKLEQDLLTLTQIEHMLEVKKNNK